MSKTSESYKTFESILNKAIDNYLLNRSENSGNQVMAQQSSLIKTYFKELRVELDQFMIEIEKETLTKLQSD